MKKALGFIAVAALCGAAFADVPAPAQVPLKFGGEFRLRPEYRRDPDFDNATSDAASFIGSRIRFGVQADPRTDVTVKVLLQDTRNWGQEASSVGLTSTAPSNFDIHEGYVEFRNILNSPVMFRAGRQELNYGDQRLVGSLNWSNNARAFDAFKAFIANDAWNADVWTAKRKENNATAGAPSRDRDFSGLYVTGKKLIPSGVVDVYALHDREGDTTGVAKPKSIVTVGARLAGKMAAFDYGVEAPYQFGDNGTVVGISSDDVKLSAFALAAKAGYTFPAHETRLGVEYDFASGSKNAADTTNHTFNNLYPTNHPYYGLMDNQGWRNMKALSASLSLKPSKPSAVSLAYWNFHLAQAHDAWYDSAGNGSGSLRGASAANEETHVGDELDLAFRYATTPDLVWEAGYGHFFAGAFIKDRVRGSSDGSDWTYVMTTVKF